MSSGSQDNAKHLPGGFRQLVGLASDDDEAVRQDGLAACAPVDGVCRQKVVAANPEGMLAAVAATQKCAISADCKETRKT